MSLGLGHFAFGAMLTALVLAVFLPRIPYPRTLTILGGTWALLPDAVKLVGNSPKLTAFHNSPIADVFWLHYTLDVVDPADSARVSTLFVAGLLLVTMFAEFRARQRRGETEVRTQQTESEYDQSSQSD